MNVKEIWSKSILSASKIYDYVINPYVGCQHGCSYCYAKFMRRFTGHREAWGAFVDVKINAPDLLHKEIKKRKMKTVWISGVCDPYQPLEVKYQITRQCLDILAQNHWPAVIQTRSALVLRDMDIFRKFDDIEVGLSITTSNDKIRRIFEPNAPAIPERIRAIESLHKNGIKTYVMVAPILPEAESLVPILAGKVDSLIIDRMNYYKADDVYEKYGWKGKNTDDYFDLVGSRMADECVGLGIECKRVY